MHTMTISLKNLNDVPPQAVFNAIALHLLTQQKKALRDDEYCGYRAPDGCKCAFGILIADDEYSPEMESYNWHRAWRQYDRTAADKAYDSELQAILYGTQNVHDLWDAVNWREEMGKLALSLDLDPTVIF